MAELPSFDPYHVLGVDKSADAASIKKAYRKLALLKHPDKCLDDALRNARTDEFQQLNEAYDILGDDDKRQRHDTLVKLYALRKEKANMMGNPRSFARASTFHSGVPTTRSTAFTSRGPANVEDRAPRMSSEDEDSFRFPRSYTDYDFSRRSAPPPARERERTKSEKEASERRRDERKRDNGIREARFMKYDYGDDKYDFSHRAEDEKRKREKAQRSKEESDPLRSKYGGWAEDLHKYTGLSRETRPTMGRRSSTRAVPPVQVRRSSATPRESSRSQREYEDQEILVRERRLREEREKHDHDAKASRRDRERRERDREYEPSSPRFRPKENTAPYDQRPPSLQHSNSSPPFANVETREPLSRTRTEPPQSSHTTPSVLRSQTMPVPSNISSKRAPQAPSGLRKSAAADELNSSDSSDSDRKPSKSSAKPVRRTHYYMAQPSSSEDNTVKYETRAPRQRRTVSPEPSKPSAGAVYNVTHLLPKRPSAAQSRSSSHNLPHRPARSPDRSSRRERDRDRSYVKDDLLYGERTPQSQRRDSHGDSRYDDAYTKEEPKYVQRPATGRKERVREPFAGYLRPGMHRQFSSPLTATSQ